MYNQFLLCICIMYRYKYILCRNLIICLCSGQVILYWCSLFRDFLNSRKFPCRLFLIPRDCLLHRYFTVIKCIMYILVYYILIMLRTFVFNREIVCTLVIRIINVDYKCIIYFVYLNSKRSVT